MARIYPSVAFSDFYGSAGDVTMYHQNGKLYSRRRSAPVFPNTERQNDNAALHLRALDAWRSLEWDVQKEWNRLAVHVESHQPPYDHKAFISGNNLFVSAYHGFAQLGREHVPEPQPFQKFPDFWVEEVVGTCLEGDDLVLQLRSTLPYCDSPSRFRLLTKVYLAAPGKGMKNGRLRNFISDRAFSAQEDTIPVRVYDYLDVAEDELPAYRLHLMYILLDEQTGYRPLWKRMAADISI